MDINIIVLDNFAFNMNDMVYQHNYGAINIDDTKSEGLYVLHFTPIPYMLQYSIEINGDTITEGTLVSGAKYMSPVQENSNFCFETEFCSISTTVSLNTELLPN